MRLRLDFIVAGAQKAGSTSLQAMLSAHPAVFLEASENPILEERFLDAPTVERFNQFVRRRAEASQLVGIKRPDYLLDQAAAEAASRTAPSAKVYVVVRDPARRLWSASLHYMKAGRVPVEDPESLIERLLTSPSRLLSDAEEELVEFGRYAKGLRFWTDLLGRDQVLVLETAQLFGAEGRALVAEHIGIDPAHFSPSMHRRNTGVYDLRRIRVLSYRERIGPNWHNARRWTPRNRHWRRLWTKPVAVAVEAFDRLYASRRWCDQAVLSSSIASEIHAYYLEDSRNLAAQVGWTPSWLDGS